MARMLTQNVLTSLHGTFGAASIADFRPGRAPRCSARLSAHPQAHPFNKRRISIKERRCNGYHNISKCVQNQLFLLKTHVRMRQRLGTQ